MFSTNIGAFNGKSWEALCQQVFKKKYGHEDYQQIPASPGDFGLEGFTLKTGYGFQCYCPEKHYTKSELYEAQRNKITKDLGKLKTYESDFIKLLGGNKIGHWIFVTPEIDRNALLIHARNKEEEVQRWNLSFLKSDFRILLHDIDHYLVEINEIKSAVGVSLQFNDSVPILPLLSESNEIYENNVRRKCKTRLAPKSSSTRFDYLAEQLHQQTLSSFLEADGYFRRIASSAPTLYYRLIGLINEYEKYVVETSATWTGSAEELTIVVRDGLRDRISRDLAPEFDETEASKVARHMVARWLAICELDYD